MHLDHWCSKWYTWINRYHICYPCYWFLFLSFTLFLPFVVLIEHFIHDFFFLSSLFLSGPLLPSDKNLFNFQGHWQSHTPSEATPGRYHFSSPWTSHVHCFTSPVSCSAEFYYSYLLYTKFPTRLKVLWKQDYEFFHLCITFGT